MTLTRLSPGILVQYRTSGSFLPSWPAVICTDNMAPKELVRARPTGYVTLVLKMGDNLDFRWALTTEMSDYDPSIPFRHEDMVGSTPGLGDAYEMANNALESHLGLDYWHEQVVNAISNAEGSEREASGLDEDACSEPDMRKALRLSREEFYGKQSTKKTARSARLPTPSLSPPVSARYPGSQRIAVPADVGGSWNLFTPAWTGPPNAAASSTQTTSQDRELSTLSSSRKRLRGLGPDMPIDLTNDSSYSRSVGKRSVESTPLSQPSLFDKALYGLNCSRKEPISDAVEGEIFESKEFVQILVGPNSEVSTLQKESIWNRQYFRNPLYGVNLFDHNDNGIWELQHPALVEIEPDDFVFVAEYLESEGFGHRYPQAGDEMGEAFAQCVSAWITAEKLSMSDMMDHVVEKLKRLIQPEMQEVLGFACQVYDAQDTVLPSQARLKDYLAMYIAENWWIYLDDDNLSSDFIERLKRLPELERDIYQRRLAALDDRLEEDQEDSETEMN